MTEQEESLLYTQLGYRIKDLRESAQIKQGAFAQLFGLSRASIVNIEKGRQRPTILFLWQISKILNIEVGVIIQPLEIQVKHNTERLSPEWKKAINKSAKDSPEAKRKITDFLKEVTSNK